MTQLEKLERSLDENLNKKAPYKIPEDGRKKIAGALWWLSLVVGILQLWAAWHLWSLSHTANRLIDYANSLSTMYGGGAVVQHLGFFYYVSLIALAISAVIALLAAPGLKAMRKSGWNLLFYGVLINAVYGVLSAFDSSYGGLTYLFGALVGSVLGAYVLFQVRDRFMKSSTTEHKAGTAKA